MASTLLGTTSLEYVVSPGARIAGRFLPTSALAPFDWVFDLYSTAAATNDRAVLREYVASRNKLRLELWDAGVRIAGEVELISTWEDGTRIIHVTSADRRLWRSRLRPD